MSSGFEIVGDSAGALPGLGSQLAQVAPMMAPQMLQAFQSMPVQVARPLGAPPGVGVQISSTPGTMRRLIAPVPAKTIGPAAVDTIIVRPQRDMRIERIVLQSSVTPPTAVITDIRIGARSLFNNSGAVPINLFQSTAVDTMLRGYTCKAGMDISLDVNVPGIAGELITGAFVGESLDD